MVGSVVKQSDVVVEDSWDVMGLEGTGSCHYRMDDVVVQPEFTTPFGGVHANRGGPWFENPTITFLSPGHTGIALGSARRALDLLNGELTNRVRFASSGAIADSGAFQRDYGEMSCRYEAARAYAMSTLDEAMALREAGERTTQAQDARIRAMVTWVTDTCVDVVRFAHHTGGGAAAFSDSPLQRLLRDILVASQHIYVADSAYETHRRLPPGPSTGQRALTETPRRSAVTRQYQLASLGLWHAYHSATMFRSVLLNKRQSISSASPATDILPSTIVSSKTSCTTPRATV